MRSIRQVFHLAIPTHDLQLAKLFYVDKLGCDLARQYEDRITINFFGDQVVCHLAPGEIDLVPKMYPRHFGLTFFEANDFDALLNRAKHKGLEFYRDCFVRFVGLREEHKAFFLRDPSNNLLEFKYYLDSEMIY